MRVGIKRDAGKLGKKVLREQDKKDPESQWFLVKAGGRLGWLVASGLTDCLWAVRPLFAFLSIYVMYARLPYCCCGKERLIWGLQFHPQTREAGQQAGIATGV